MVVVVVVAGKGACATPQPARPKTSCNVTLGLAQFNATRPVSKQRVVRQFHSRSEKHLRPCGGSGSPLADPCLGATHSKVSVSICLGAGLPPRVPGLPTLQ